MQIYCGLFFVIVHVIAAAVLSCIVAWRFAAAFLKLYSISATHVAACLFQWGHKQ
jgi:hypothetical protein